MEERCRIKTLLKLDKKTIKVEQKDNQCWIKRQLELDKKTNRVEEKYSRNKYSRKQQK